MSQSHDEETLRDQLVRHRLLTLSPGDSVLSAMLGQAVYLLDRFWIHAHEQAAHLRWISSRWHAQRHLHLLSLVLNEHHKAVSRLVAREQDRDGRHAWELLAWLAAPASHSLITPASVSVDVAPGTPAYFGEPLPLRAVTGPLTRLQFNVASRSEHVSRGRQLLDLALDELTLVHGWVLKHELANAVSASVLKFEVSLGECLNAQERKRANQRAHELFWG